MKYEFKIDKSTNRYDAKFYCSGYEEFGGWLCYESAAEAIHNKVLDYIESGSEKTEVVCGSEYVNYLSPDGLSIRAMEAFEPDLDGAEYPESNKITLKSIKKIIVEWRMFKAKNKLKTNE